MRNALIASILLVSCGIPAFAQAPLPPADTLGVYSGAVAETRTVLTFKVGDEVVQKLLPDGWTLAPIAQGPAKGANLAVVFSERLATVDQDGKAAGGEEASVILSIPAKNGAESAFAIIEAYGDAETAPGFYKAGKPATVTAERSLRVANLKGTIEETWSVAGNGGERISFQIGYERLQPSRAQFDSRNVSAVDGRVRRTYRIDQGTVVLVSAANGVDKAKGLTFKATGGLLGRLFDGSHQLVSAVSLPWYSRQLYVPASQ
ncbi:hypothetical protein [Methylobacterium nonmethylotrophicum]|uniref:Uncharacterized protein n=1 Tax=Methylobacterium nonmethylotrophicum TaxID=1141884 RepID=A0A4Z0NKN9_9HYPH|nr:hypothetical protein [Methylobacterium nonmethylotrophicum]TGD96307.1 hypothetical protein EU555_24255 [Methylobacterium nonmethylotrophicum]